MVSRINAGCLGLALCLALSLVCSSVPAQDDKKVRGEFGLLFGFLDGMTIEATAKDSGSYGGSIDSDMGISGGVSFDQPLFRSLWVGLTIDLFQVRKNFIFVEFSSRALNPSLRLSYHYRPTGSKWSVRPGAACGVALVEEIIEYKASQYLTLRPFIQVVCHMTNRTGLLFELSEFQTLQGGNDDYDIDAGPTWGFRVGLLK